MPWFPDKQLVSKSRQTSAAFLNSLFDKPLYLMWSLVISGYVFLLIFDSYFIGNFLTRV